VKPADAVARLRVRRPDAPRVLVVEEHAVSADRDPHEHRVAHLADEDAACHRLVADLVGLAGARQLDLLHLGRALLLVLRVEVAERRRLVLQGPHSPQSVVHPIDAARLAPCPRLRRGGLLRLAAGVSRPIRELPLQLLDQLGIFPLLFAQM